MTDFGKKCVFDVSFAQNSSNQGHVDQGHVEGGGEVDRHAGCGCAEKAAARSSLPQLYMATIVNMVQTSRSK